MPPLQLTDHDAKLAPPPARFRWSVLSIVVAIFLISTTLTAAATCIILYEVIDEEVSTKGHASGALLVKGYDEGLIAQTATAEHNGVPFLVAPLLSIEQLGSVKSLHVTRRQLGPGYVSGFQVIGFDWVSKLQMHFDTTEGFQVHYDHGLTYLQYKNDNNTVMREKICTNNITCSAFYVNGIDVAAKRAEMFGLLDDLANTAHGNSSLPTRALHEADQSRLNAHAVRLHEARLTLGLSSISELSTFHVREQYVNEHGRKLGAGTPCPPGYQRSYGGRRMHASEDQQEMRKTVARALEDLPICCQSGGEGASCEYGFYCAPADGSCGSCYYASFTGGAYCDCSCPADSQWAIQGMC